MTWFDDAMIWFITSSFIFLHMMPSKATLSHPINLTVNLVDVLAAVEWLPGPGNPPGTKYTLEIIFAENMSRGNWNRSSNCSDIPTCRCDLTFEQRPDEIYRLYFVRIKSTFEEKSSIWTTSKSFQPYETRLSSPDVGISTEQHTITIRFSHRLETHPVIKPLEFLICLFENGSVGSNSKTVVAHASTSKSPHIYYDVPYGKNYCVNVSASHQQFMHTSNFNTTKCFFLEDSSRSPSGLVVLIVAMVIIAMGAILTSVYFYQRRFKIKDLHIPGVLFVFAGTKMVLNFYPERINVITSMWSNAVLNTEEHASAPEENDSLIYHRWDCPTPNVNPSSVVQQEPDVRLYPAEEEVSLNVNFSDYHSATYMEEIEENCVCKDDDSDMRIGDTVEFTSNLNLPLFAESETPQLHTVSINLDRDDEETERPCEMCPHGSVSQEEDDISFWDYPFSYDVYEPRADPVGVQ